MQPIQMKFEHRLVLYLRNSDKELDSCLKILERDPTNGLLFHFLFREDPIYNNSTSYALCEFAIALMWVKINMWNFGKQIIGAFKK